MITAAEVADLFDSPNPYAEIEREGRDPVTKAGLDTLIEGGPLDLDEDGRPIDAEWEVLADQLNS